MCVWMCVFVCVRARARVCVWVCVRARACVRLVWCEHVRACVCARTYNSPPPFSSLLHTRRWPGGATFPLAAVTSICRGVAAALAYLHSKRVCHGDVYAHNILYDPETHRAVLCDFGAPPALLI